MNERMKRALTISLKVSMDGYMGAFREKDYQSVWVLEMQESEAVEITSSGFSCLSSNPGSVAC